MEVRGFEISQKSFCAPLIGFALNGMCLVYDFSTEAFDEEGARTVDGYSCGCG